MIKNKDLTLHSIKTNNYSIREETLNGRVHIVVPVVMMKEGVHTGSHGAIYHVPEELERFTAAWNGIPVMIQHPEEDGVNVSANSPRVIETAVGVIFNTVYDDGLRAEVWIDVEKIKNSDPDALAYIRQGRPLDVSVGVFTDEEPTQGEWNGESYETIARNYRPDHLALLPGETGACSWADGCGIRNNQEGGKMNDILKSFKDLSKKGYVVSLLNNEEGFQEISNLLQAKLDSMDTNIRFYYLEEVYTNEFVYRIRDAEGGSTLYRRGYSVNNGEVTFAENLVEVRKSVTYLTMQMKRTKNNSSINLNEKEEMSDKQIPCCEDTVDKLIANKATRFTSSDKEWLMTQERSVIDKLLPIEPVKVNKEDKEIAAEAVKVFKTTLKQDAKPEDYLELMPEAMKATFEAGATLYKEKRKTLVKGITDNSKEFTEDELIAMDDSMLDKLSKMANVTDYSGQIAGGTLKKEEIVANEDILLPEGVELETK